MDFFIKKIVMLTTDKKSAEIEIHSIFAGLGNGPHVLGNGPHVLGNWPHVLGNWPHC